MLILRFVRVSVFVVFFFLRVLI